MVNLEGKLAKGDVLIIVSPVVWTAEPLGGIHRLQAACQRAGETTCVLYSNLIYSNFMDIDVHTTIAVEDYFLLGERLFAASAFDLPPMGRNFNKLFDPGRVPDHIWPKHKETQMELIPTVLLPFRERLRTIDWEDLETRTRSWLQSLACQIAEMGYRIVGCSTTFGGLTPAIALLKWIKKANPGIITVLGGSLCEGEMAEGILSLNCNVDYIFSGEGEKTFPTLVRRILSGDLPKEKIIYGEIITNLDRVPFPDYEEYFQQRKHFLLNTTSAKRSSSIPYETSRGCWFGKCTFCGLMGEEHKYRKKSPDHIIKELKKLIRRYGINNIFLTDNIIPPVYLKTLFPRLAVEIPSIRLIFEIKANLTLNQLQTIQKAGVTLIQPGIESLSPSLLRHMDKGMTAQENIALLRYARSLNLSLKWNLLFGFPGDQRIEYEKMLHLLPLIHHLQPPDRMISVRICRFSRYHRSPEAFGISNLRPAEVHKDVLPGHADADKLATLFAGDYDAGSFENPGLIYTLYKELKAWRNQWASYNTLPLISQLPTLHLSRKSSDEFVLHDTRNIPGRSEKLILDKKKANLILVARPWHDSPEFQWAVDAKLGVVLDSWFIPLATAEPALLKEFEDHS